MNSFYLHRKLIESQSIQTRIQTSPRSPTHNPQQTTPNFIGKVEVYRIDL